jgi:hypothetical protein
VEYHPELAGGKSNAMTLDLQQLPTRKQCRGKDDGGVGGSQEEKILDRYRWVDASLAFDAEALDGKISFMQTPMTMAGYQPSGPGMSPSHAN